MKILVVADIHGEIGAVSKLVEKVKNTEFDMVICPGDFTDMFNIPEGYSQTDMAETVIQKLVSLGKPLLCIPGNQDPYEITELFEEYDVNLHAVTREIGGIHFIGFGGAATPFNTKFEPTEEEITDSLERSAKEVGKRFLLVTHNPPAGTKLDKVESGEHVGSKAIRKFIEKHAPLLNLSAHIHENSGVDTIGKTKIFYPGTLYEGNYGLVRLGKTVKCEIKKF